MDILLFIYLHLLRVISLLQHDSIRIFHLQLNHLVGSYIIDFPMLSLILRVYENVLEEFAALHVTYMDPTCL